MSSITFLDDGRTQCDNCGNIWDGNAQCTCLQWMYSAFDQYDDSDNSDNESDHESVHESVHENDNEDVREVHQVSDDDADTTDTEYTESDLEEDFLHENDDDTILTFPLHIVSN